MLSRRGAIKVGLFGAGVLALGSVTLATRSTRLRNPRQPLRFLTPAEYSILAAVADRICPPNGAFIAPAEAEVPERIDALLARAHPGFAAEIRQLLHLFENGLANFVFDRRPRPFTQLDPADQDAALADWASSKLVLRRMGFKALQGLVVAAYYSNPRTYAAVGYPGPPVIGEQGPSLAVPVAMRLEEQP